MKIKLSEIVIDENIIVRRVDDSVACRYADSMRSGNQFPPLLIDQKKRLICGHHRYSAYKKSFDENYTVRVIQKNISNEKEAIKVSVTDNVKNANPLTSFDRKNIIFKLLQLGESKKDISDLLCLSLEKIEVYSSDFVLVKTATGKEEKKPLKRGFSHISGKSVSEEDYEDHEKKDVGLSVSFHAKRIISVFEKQWIDEKNEKTMAELRRLYNVLKLYFEK